MQNKRIAVTGGIGSGKSTFCRILKEKGYPVFSCDEISKQLSGEKEYLAVLQDAFPDCVSNGRLNKSALSDKVFSNKTELERLNQCTHPLIMQRLFSMMSEYPFSFAEVPLLFEAGFEHLFDTVIVIRRAREKRVASVMARSGMKEEEIIARMQNQFDYENLPETEYTVVVNDGSEEELRANAEIVLSRLGL